MITFSTFLEARLKFTESFRHRSYEVKGPRWQGLDISTKPEMQMRELFNQSFQVPLRGFESIEHWQNDITPNLPWADVHFAERIGGEPLNPGESWKTWPWGNAADKFRTQGGKFDHTYMERFWPKYADRAKPGSGKACIETCQCTTQEQIDQCNGITARSHHGIRYEYGDLNDLVNHLAADPLSRQAYLPIWFPEDGTCPGRKPCTLGYHFLMRHEYFHITYYIRSCDFIRHWADDCYLAVRLLLWVLDSLREKDATWRHIKPGLFVMHIASLHMFRNDYERLLRGEKDISPV